MYQCRYKNNVNAFAFDLKGNVIQEINARKQIMGSNKRLIDILNSEIDTVVFKSNICDKLLGHPNLPRTAELT